MKRENPSETVVCEVCGLKPAQHRCPLCGRYVCDDDWDEVKGTCVLCASTLCQICGKRLAVGTCAYCGRLVCEKCSVQLTPVIRLCVECYKSLRGVWPPHELVESEVSKLARTVEKLLYTSRKHRRG